MTASGPIRDDELDALFRPLINMDVVLLAVSGGLDSTALLHLAARWRQRHEDGPVLVVATVDHRLRSEGAAEAASVAAAARALGLDHHTIVWDGAKPVSGIQAAARAARYRLLASVLQTALTAAPRRDRTHVVRGAVVTAHTADDQAETFIMHLARGSGIDGLAGIAPMSTHTIEATHNEPATRLVLLRPLLDVARARLAETLHDSGLAYADDPSNDDARFERVRIRRALATLEAVGLSRAAIARSTRRLRRANTCLDAVTRELLLCAVDIPFGLYVRLDRAAFMTAAHEIALRAFRHAVRAMGGKAPAADLAATEAAFSQLFQGPSSPAPPAAVTLGGCIIERLHRSPGTNTESVRIFREEARDGSLERIRLLPGAQYHWDKRFAVTVHPELDSPAVVAAVGDDWALLKTAHPDLARLPIPARAGRTMPCVRWSDGRLTCPSLAAVAATLRQHRNASSSGDRDRSFALTDSLDAAALDTLERAAAGTIIDKTSATQTGIAAVTIHPMPRRDGSMAVAAESDEL